VATILASCANTSFRAGVDMPRASTFNNTVVVIVVVVVTRYKRGAKT